MRICCFEMENKTMEGLTWCVSLMGQEIWKVLFREIVCLHLCSSFRNFDEPITEDSFLCLENLLMGEVWEYFYTRLSSGIPSTRIEGKGALEGGTEGVQFDRDFDELIQCEVVNFTSHFFLVHLCKGPYRNRYTELPHSVNTAMVWKHKANWKH